VFFLKLNVNHFISRPSLVWTLSDQNGNNWSSQMLIETRRIMQDQSPLLPFLLTMKRLIKIVLLLLLLVAGFSVYRSIFASNGVAEEVQSPVVVATDNSDEEIDANWITASLTQAKIDASAHPLEPLLEIAELAGQRIDREYFDYTATLTNQIRFKGKLREPHTLQVKIRHQRVDENGRKIPFSVYTKFIDPPANAGREVIWMDGWNDGNLMVHLTGWQNLMRISLDPNGSMAMDGNLYPITMIGMRNLLKQIQEKGARDLNHAPGRVTFKRGLRINDRTVTLIESIHPKQEPHFDYHIAKIYLDEELGLPVGYEGYLWPEKEGDPPLLLEKYFYTDIQLNVGLTDKDFDPNNPEYQFPGR
jgi:hypothetical protein